MINNAHVAAIRSSVNEAALVPSVPRLVPTTSWPQLQSDTYTILIQFKYYTTPDLSTIYFEIKDGQGVTAKLNLFSVSGTLAIGSSVSWDNVLSYGNNTGDIISLLINVGAWQSGNRPIAVYDETGTALMTTTDMYFGYILEDPAAICATLPSGTPNGGEPASKFKILSGVYTNFATADAVTGPDLIFNGLDF